jgi:hypothetical protein
MKNIEIDCWEVTEPDGGGISSNHVAYFSDKNVAYQFIADKKTHWIDKEPRRFQKTFVILDSISELQILAKRSAIAAAKAKLTKEELRLLGIE